MSKRFISFKTQQELEQEKIQEALQKEIVGKIVSLCGESAELENELQNEFNTYTLKRLTSIIQRSTKSIIESINKYNVSVATIVPETKKQIIYSGTAPLSSFVSITGTTGTAKKDIVSSVKSNDDIINQMLQEKIKKAQEGRALDNGGLAPPSTWKSVNDVDLSNTQKKSLVEEMKNLHLKGIAVNKTTFHHKPPITMDEFTEPFKFLENMHDYNGPFIVSLLKNSSDMISQSVVNGFDLTPEIQECNKHKKILISIYDIGASVLKGEEKKFIISLNFDSLNGSLSYDKSIFQMLSNNKKLTSRQIEEVKKFCTSKKVSNETVC